MASCRNDHPTDQAPLASARSSTQNVWTGRNAYAVIRRDVPRTRTFRAGFLALLMGTASALPLLAASATRSWAAGEVAFNIPAGDLGSVLAQIGRVGAQPISFPADLTRGRRAGPIVGTMGVREALARALAGTGLVIVPGAGGTLRVSAAGPVPAAGGTAVAGDIAAIDVVDANGGSPYGDQGFKPGAVGDTLRIADAPLKETPVAVSVVTNEVIRSQNVTNPLDAARNAAGVVVKETSASEPRFLIRGFETQGFSINGQLNSEYQQIPIDAVDRIEVLKGPTSILSGATSEGGGLVNVTLKKPTETEIRELTVRYGTFNYKTIAVDLGGRMPELEGTTYRFVTSLEHADQSEFGYRDPSKFLVMPSVRWQGDNLTLTTGLRYVQARVVNPVPFGYRSIARDPITGEPGFFRIPGNGPGNPGAHIDVNELTFDTEQNYHVGTVFGLFDVSFNNIFQHTSVRATGQSFTIWNDNFGYNQFGLQQASDIQNQNITERLSMVVKYQDEWVKSTTKFGFDLLTRFSDARTAPAVFMRYNLLTNFPITPLISGNYTRQQSISSNTFRGGYVVEKLDLFNDKLHVLGSVRWDWFNTNSRTFFDREIDFINTSNTEALSYTFGALLDLPYDTGIYINRSNGTFPQAPSQGQTLQPIGRVLNEFGLRHSAFDNRLNTTLSFFELTESPLNLAIPNSPGFPNGVQIVTVDGLRSRGIEFEAQGEILPGWNVIANATRLWTERLDPEGFGLDPRAGRANYQGSLWSTYTWQTGWAEGVTVGAGVRGLTGFKVNVVGGDSFFRLPGYAIFDAAIGYASGDYSVNLKVNNLLDNRPFALAITDSYLPIERGRSVVMQANYRF